MNNDPILGLAIVGTIVWIFFAIKSEWPSIKDTYYTYLKPQIKFVVTDHDEGARYEIIEGKHILKGVTVYIEGYFENSGGVASTVKAIETQFVRRYGKLKLPVGKSVIRAAYYVEGDRGLTDYRGIYINEYSVSRKVKADSTCLFNGESQIDKLEGKYLIRVRWRVLGQGLKDIEIEPKWDNVKRSAKELLSRPVPDISNIVNE
jgi:hypothetical protein